MQSYTIDTEKTKSISNYIIEDYNLDVDHCCKRKNKITVYSDDKTINKIKKLGYNFIKDKQEPLYKNKSLNKRLGQYHFQKDIDLFLKNIKSNYPNLMDYEIIGKSVKNRDLFIAQLTSSTKQLNNKPNYLLTANIHGDETIGRELTLYLIDHLCNYYTKDPLIKYLLDNTTIYINPTLNPDGFEKTIFGKWHPSRFNHNRVDLNRNFPDQFNNKIKDKDREPEVRAIMNWSDSRYIHMSISIHAGSVVINYPFDGPKTGVYSPTKEDDYFKYLSREYVNHSAYFKQSEFQGGITNGAEWYSVNGGMQDWRHSFKKGYELTLELSEEKVVKEKNIEIYWKRNKYALINSIRLLHIGMKITVKNSFITKNINTIIVKNNELNYEKKYTIPLDKEPVFIPLKPGNYELLYGSDKNKILIKENNTLDIVIKGSTLTSNYIPIPPINKNLTKMKGECVLL